MTSESEPTSVSVRAYTFSYLDILALVLRRRRVIVVTGCIAAMLVGVATLLQHRRWSVESSFMPQSRRQGAGLSGIAAQLGLSLPMVEASESHQFFEALLRARGVVRGVVESEYDFPGSPSSRGTLIDYYRSRAESHAERLAQAERTLRSHMLTSIDSRAGLVTLRVTERSGEMATQISRRFLDLLDKFNREQRQSQAAAERKFTERRLAEVHEELLRSESALQRFLSRNRSFARSSEAAFEEDRLRADMQLRQQLYSSLALALEQAKIEEVRDTPVITLVEAPTVPLEPDRRWLLARTVLAFSGAMILSIATLIGQSLLRGASRSYPAAAEELAILREEAWRDLRRPWRLVGVGT
jgi:uncharacterized protein involved in exopolysaccharide biosynthesis